MNICFKIIEPTAEWRVNYFVNFKSIVNCRVFVVNIFRDEFILLHWTRYQETFVKCNFIFIFILFRSKGDKCKRALGYNLWFISITFSVTSWSVFILRSGQVVLHFLLWCRRGGAWFKRGVSCHGRKIFHFHFKFPLGSRKKIICFMFCLRHCVVIVGLHAFSVADKSLPYTDKSNVALQQHARSVVLWSGGESHSLNEVIINQLVL